MTKNENHIRSVGTLESISYEARRGRSERFLRFTPKRAVKQLRKKHPTHAVARPWAAMCLIVWALLDGRARKRSDGNRKYIHTDNGRRAGNIFLLSKLHELQPKKEGNSANLYADTMDLFERTEGFANAIDGRWAGDILEECADSDGGNRLMLEIAKYVIRREQLPPNRRSIEDAKYFVSRYEHFAIPGTARGQDKLEKGWFKSLRGLPYLLALYEHPEFTIDIFRDLDRVVRWVDSFTESSATTDIFLGKAASFADELSKAGIAGIRLSDFVKVKRHPITIPDFDAKELEFILREEWRTPTDDMRDYRPRVHSHRNNRKARNFKGE